MALVVADMRPGMCDRLMGGTCGGNTEAHLAGTDGEQIWLGIAPPKAFFGPFVKIQGKGYGGNLWCVTYRTCHVISCAR